MGQLKKSTVPLISLCNKLGSVAGRAQIMSPAAQFSAGCHQRFVDYATAVRRTRCEICHEDYEAGEKSLFSTHVY